MPYHVRITLKSNPSSDEVKLDLTEQQLEKRFLVPYRAGSPIVVGGKTITPKNIDRIRITHTEEISDKLLSIIREKRLKFANVFGLSSLHSEDWDVADWGVDVTDELVKNPPGNKEALTTSIENPVVNEPHNVFVVHGRNTKVRDSLFAFLRSIGLHPIEWAEAVSATNKSSPYIGEVLDKALSIAQAIVVLMTPDDEARLRESLQTLDDPHFETQFTPQARPNVLFEAGMAMGRSPERTILVELGILRPFSDIGGRHTIKLDNTLNKRRDFALRLKTAGCPINLSGTNWQKAGDFEVDSHKKNGFLVLVPEEKGGVAGEEIKGECA